MVRALGLGVLGVALLLERLVLDDLFNVDFFCVKRVFGVAGKLVEFVSTFVMGFHPKSSILTHMMDFLRSSYVCLDYFLDITRTTKSR